MRKSMRKRRRKNQPKQLPRQSRRPRQASKMASLETSLFSNSGEDKGKITLSEDLFGFEGSRRTLHQVLVAYANNLRQGTSSTKTRGLVSGGGRKPWKQKGTGNARSGSNRSPLWRKGGIIFGPLPRSYRIDVPASKKLLALQTALAEKAKASEIAVIESIEFKEGKSKQASDLLQKAGVGRRLMLVVDKKDPMLKRAAR